MTDHTPIPPYSWQVDKIRSQEFLKTSNWLPQFTTSVECSINFPTIIGLFIGMQNFAGQNMITSIINALRQPWRCFAYDLVDSTGAPIATEKAFLDYLTANPSVEHAYSPAEWIANKVTFPYNGTDYPTDFFTPLQTDLLSVELSGLYTLRTTDGTAENYVAGRELYKQTPLVNDGNPLDSTWINNLYYLTCKGSDPDDGFTLGVTQMNTLLSQLGNSGIYFPFNFQLDLPQTSGYTNVRITLQITFNVQNVFVRSNWFYCDFPIDSTRAPNSYNISTLDFTNVRNTQMFQHVNSCIGLTQSINKTVPASILNAATSLQQLIFMIGDTCQTKKISQMYKLVADLKVRAQNCLQLLSIQTNVVYQQSEGFLQLLDLINSTSLAIKDIQTLNPNLPNVTSWTELVDSLNQAELMTNAGAIYSGSIAKMKRPLYVQAEKNQKRLFQQLDNLNSTNPNIPLILVIVVLCILGFLFFLSLGAIVHKNKK